MLRHKISSALALGCALIAGACQAYLGESADSEGGAGATPGLETPLPSDVAAQNNELLSLEVRRLSHRELAQTLSDLLYVDWTSEGTVFQESDLTPDAEVAGYDNNAKALQPSSILLSEYADVFETSLKRHLNDWREQHPCDDDETPEACSKQLIADFGERAFRGKWTDADLTSFDDYFWTGDPESSFDSRLRRTFRAILKSPEFLYRTELGREDDEDKLTQVETASRLSYLLWASMPDDALLDAATTGKLETQEQIETHVDRMLDDPRARLAFSDFFEQWMHLGKVSETSKDPKLEPADRNSVKSESKKFFRDFLWEQQGSFDDLFTSRVSFVDDSVASVYEIEGPGAEGEWLEVELPQERAGILTRLAPLVIGGHREQKSPVLRGTLVLDRVLCVELGQPPAEAQNAQVPSGEDPETNREEYELLTAGGSCDGCHNIINPVGFTFENFDTVGRYEEMEGDITIDASGALPGGDDVVGAAELSAALAERPDVAECLAKHWLRFGQNGGIDPDLAGALSQALSGDTLRAALRSVATDPRFYSQKHSSEK